MLGVWDGTRYEASRGRGDDYCDNGNQIESRHFLQLASSMCHAGEESANIPRL